MYISNNSCNTFLKPTTVQRLETLTVIYFASCEHIFNLGHQAEHVFWQQHAHFFCLRSLSGVCEPEAFVVFLKKDSGMQRTVLPSELTAEGGQK